jgi:CheY-like chemotaxis protein
VFEPFFTTKESGKGTGLGLSTVQAIVKQSGGEVEVRSLPGQGTCFTISLPMVRQTGETHEITPPVMETGPGPQGETVLLVEDEEGVRRLFSHILRKEGYEVLEAQDGAEALRLFQQRQGKIHLVVTDMVMPNMGGRVLGERLCELQADLRIIYMSGYTDDVLVRTGAIGPGMAFLQKPLRPEALAAKVRESLKQRSA